MLACWCGVCVWCLGATDFVWLFRFVLLQLCFYCFELVVVAVSGLWFVIVLWYLFVFVVRCLFIGYDLLCLVLLFVCIALLLAWLVVLLDYDMFVIWVNVMLSCGCLDLCLLFVLVWCWVFGCGGWGVYLLILDFAVFNLRLFIIVIVLLYVC